MLQYRIALCNTETLIIHKYVASVHILKSNNFIPLGLVGLMVSHQVFENVANSRLQITLIAHRYVVIQSIITKAVYSAISSCVIIHK